jgi:hypothetical protein
MAEKYKNLRDLGCTGNWDQPLDVFVAPRSNTPSERTSPRTTLGFHCSDRGSACNRGAREAEGLMEWVMVDNGNGGFLSCWV